MSSHHDPLSVALPYQFSNQDDFPTEIVAHRFQAWRYILKDLIAYLRQYASVQEEILRQQARLQQTVGASAAVASSTPTLGRPPKDKQWQDDLQAINEYFLPIGNGSIQDIPTILTRFHQQNIENGTKTLKEIQLVVIPRLEDLRKDLVLKIKEIRKLQNDFKNTLSKDLQDSSALLSKFNHAIEIANRHELLTTSGEPVPHSHDSHHELDSSKRDPYLVRLKLKDQLSRQLKEERYLYDAYENLQLSSQKLESIVVLEVQNCLLIFLNLVQNEHSTIPEFLVPRLSDGFLSKESLFEWNSFIDRNLPKTSTISKNLMSGKFIDLLFPARKLADLNIPHFDSLVNLPIREGVLERRSKFLNKYSSGWYVLTCSYLHEFKTNDRKRDPHPVMSLALDTCSVDKHTKKDDSKLLGSYKFILYSKQQNGIIHRGHNWSFKCGTFEEMILWYNDIKQLTQLASPSARAKAFSKVLQAKKIEAGDKKMSRASSLLSAQTGPAARSVRSNYTNASKTRQPLSPAQSLRSKALSQTVSATSTGQNQRLSSTFSQKNYHQSPKLSNLINSDGTIVTPVDTHQAETFKDHEHGDTTLAGQLSQYGDEQDHDIQHDPQFDQYSQGGPKSVPMQNGTQGTPQQFIPQNYQYYFSQVNSQPQQFYDPVLQQFFTINAIPVPDASQVPSSSSQGPTSTQQLQAGRTPVQGQSMPQYFPLSPQAQPQAQYFPASPNFQPQIIQTAATPQQGHQAENGRVKAAYVPHFPQHFNEQAPSGSGANAQGKPSNLPYPTNLEQHPGQSRQNLTTSTGSLTVAKTVPGAFKTVDENLHTDDQISQANIR